MMGAPLHLNDDVFVYWLVVARAKVGELTWIFNYLAAALRFALLPVPERRLAQAGNDIGCERREQPLFPGGQLASQAVPEAACPRDNQPVATNVPIQLPSPVRANGSSLRVVVRSRPAQAASSCLRQELGASFVTHMEHGAR